MLALVDTSDSDDEPVLCPSQFQRFAKLGGGGPKAKAKQWGGRRQAGPGKTMGRPKGAPKPKANALDRKSVV